MKRSMSRNVTIIVIILIIVVLAAYLVWLRGKFTSTPPQAVQVQETIVPSPSVSLSPSPSASSSALPSPSIKVSSKSAVPAK